MKKFEPKKISEATADELRNYALSFLGIDVEGDTDSQVLAKVKAANEGETIFVSTADEPTSQAGSPPPAPADTSRGMVGTTGREDPRVTLVIHAEERDGVVNNRHREVGVNGVVWLLKRGEPIEVPYRVYAALNDAVREVITHDRDGNQRSQMVHNTPFSVEKMPSDEEVAAWSARVGHLELP